MTKTKQKNRLSQVDIRAIVAELRREIIGLRLANIYDINQKTYMLKFAKPDHKIHLLVESGIRLHTTKFERDKSQMPSPFTLKLRKFIRTRRCEKVEQLGVDRVVDFQFGQEEKAYHLIIEFFAKGNIILTDHNYQIIVLLRTHKKEEETAGIFAVGETYPVASRRQFVPMSRSLLLSILRSNTDEKALLKNVLNNSTDYGTGFTEHFLLKAGLNPSAKLSELNDLKLLLTTDENHAAGQRIIDALLKVYAEADNFIAFKEDHAQRGYIILSDEKTDNKHQPTLPSSNDEQRELTKLEQVEIERQEKDRQRERYEDFTPFLYQQFVNRPFLQIDTFDHAVDEFFSAIETKKIDHQKLQLENSAFKKLQKVRKEQENRINELQDDVERLEGHAQLIMQNLDLVDEAIEIVVSGVSQYSWDEIDRVVKQQKKLGDPVASAIQQLKLDQNLITMLLSSQIDDVSDDEENDDSEDNDEDEDDDNDEDYNKKSKNKSSSGPTRVDIDISLTAYGNAQYYYSLRKRSVDKQHKTVAASHKAIKVAEKRTQETLKKQQIKADIKLMRKQFWFEKFNWFITSENYLVLSGRDAQQNEMLVKRYMRKGDVYVHADVHGASSCIIKNHTFNPSTDSVEEQKTNVPAQTLHEAGIMTVCRSSAWDAKIVGNAYWVHAHQVSKSAPTGEYLPTGSFMIRGKKNYLPPNQLVMGMAIMFKLDDECIPNHIGERRRRDLNSGDDLISVASMESGTTWEMSTISDADFERSDAGSSGDEQRTPRQSEQSGEEEEEEEQQQQQQENQKQNQEQNPEEQVEPNGSSPVSDSDDDDNNQSRSTQQEEDAKKKKKGLSAKDKRLLKQLMKKGYDENTAKDMLLNDQLPSELKPKKVEQLKKEDKSVDELTHKPKGMKKGKWKKLRKYADQDEEERKLRLELIGHKYTSKEDRQKQAEEEEKQIQEDLERQKLENEKKRKEKEEIKKLLQDENIQYMDEEDLKKLSEVDSLTGQPREDDVILFAIPVCAPYISLKNYKYKVKIVPGNMKRGKAGQQALNILTHEAKDNVKEQNLLKAISDVDTTAVMVGNCRIATAVSKSQKAHQNARRRK